MMFQGSANVKKMQHVSLMQEAGGIVNGSTRFDYTNYFQSLPSKRARTRAVPRSRSHAIARGHDENLKNQQNVVSEEVRVNVLNQPHGAFDWIEIWEKANTNWHNAHDFYGDLKELEAATVEDVRQFFKTYYAPNNAVLVVAGDATAADVRRLAEKHFGSIPSQPQPKPADLGEPPQTAPKSSTRNDALGAHAGDRRGLASAAAHDEGLLRVERARSAAQQRRQRAHVSQAGARRSAGDVQLGRLQLPRSELGHEGADALHDARRLLQRQDRDQVIAAIETVLDDVRKNGITAAELAQAKTTMRSSFFDDMEGGGMPLFGRANLLAAFALFDDDPRAYQHHPQRARQSDGRRT
jgi:predicted Zn-dependent peptidase